MIKTFLSVILIISNPLNSYANCNDIIINFKDAKPIMENYFKKIKTEKDFEWGNVNPFLKIENENIFLTKDFDYMSRTNKFKVISYLKVEFGQFTQISEKSLEGNISPYNILDNLGRIISMPYDGCGNFVTLTENARINLAAIARGEPERKIVYEIDKNKEKIIRKEFHRLFGYESSISWIPELGYFEIDLYEYNKAKIKRFFNQFKSYRYTVLSNDGSFLEEKSYT